MQFSGVLNFLKSVVYDSIFTPYFYCLYLKIGLDIACCYVVYFISEKKNCELRIYNWLQAVNKQSLIS
jgi:hypothetical protein